MCTMQQNMSPMYNIWYITSQYACEVKCITLETLHDHLVLQHLKNPFTILV